MKDVIDGQMWKDSLMDPLEPTSSLLCDNNSIGLLLNVDWFKPNKRSEYKVSAIMMTVLNLPRSEPFKSTWTTILGVIPGPTEPKGNINTFLKPIVDDLISLWNGVPLHHQERCLVICQHEERFLNSWVILGAPVVHLWLKENLH
eukprot:Em0005g622a